MKISEIIDVLEQVAPLELQAEYDNSGLNINNTSAETNGVLITLDATESAVKKAVENNIKMIITHHPVIFNPLFQIDSDLIREIIKNDIAVYSAHTNFDNAVLADEFAGICGLCDCFSIDETRIGKLEKPVKFAEYVNILSEVLTPHSAFQKSVGQDKIIDTVACANGAGGGNSNLIFELKNKKVDLFVTSEIKHHVRVELAKNEIEFIEISHYDSEKHFMNFVEKLLDTYVSCVKHFENPTEV